MTEINQIPINATPLAQGMSLDGLVLEETHLPPPHVQQSAEMEFESVQRLAMTESLLRTIKNVSLTALDQKSVGPARIL